MIIFKKLRWKNFLSYGNYWTEIDFEKSPTTLISGKNGSGKSGGILDGLTFSIFGKPYRYINKPRLVNSINDKDCLVEVEFVIGNKHYMVRRGIKPVIFEIYCDGQLLNQDSKNLDYQRYLEQNIIKMNFESFTQIVVLGSSTYIPFMQLNAANRRDVIEELLDLKVFTRMNIILKEKTSQLKEDLKTLQNKLLINEEKIKTQIDVIKLLKTKVNENKQTKLIEIQKYEDNVSSLTDENTILVQEVKEVEKHKNNKSLYESKLTEFKDIIPRLKSQYKVATKTLDFYNKNNSCPTCQQNIDINFKNNTLKEIKNKVFEIENAIESAEKFIKDYTDKVEKENLIINSYLQKTIKINDNNVRIIELNKVIANIKTMIDANKDENIIDNENDKLLILEDENKNIQLEKNKLIEIRHNYDIANTLLKDNGIKSKIIKKYLPLMNKYINKYLSSMDFFVNFNLDETFKETIKSRHRDVYEYNSFSEGEKFRIDMALLLTWREIARAKNSTNTNILILDEVFDSSLDAQGGDEFLKLLKILSQSINIFVISHRSDLYTDKFDNSIKVEKRGNFSYVQ